LFRDQIELLKFANAANPRKKKSDLMKRIRVEEAASGLVADVDKCLEKTYVSYENMKADISGKNLSYSYSLILSLKLKIYRHAEPEKGRPVWRVPKG